MDRYTMKDCRNAVERLAEIFGRPTKPGADHRLPKGAWLLEYNTQYGGAVLREICNEHGGQTAVLGEGRLKPWEFCRMIRGIEDLIRGGYVKVKKFKA